MSESSILSQSSEPVEIQTRNNRALQWLLITGNRLTVTSVFLSGMFVLMVLLSVYGPRSIQQFLTSDAVRTLFSSMIIAITTTVTLVLTLAQVTLSQKLAHLGNFRARMDHAIEFRRDVEERIGISVSPARPVAFFQQLIIHLEDTLHELDYAIADGDQPSHAGETTEYINAVHAYSTQKQDQLEDARFGSFASMFPVLNHDYSWTIYAGRQLRTTHAEEFSDETIAIFDELLATLRLFGPTREYFKTLYFQDELTNFSRSVLYAALPALGVAGYMVVLFEPTAVADWLGGSNHILGINTAILVVCGMYTVTLVPFALLLAYLLRMLTVIQRTLAIGPFILRDPQFPARE
jgi:hypothetical protein